MNQIGSLLNKWLKNRGYYKKVQQQQVVVYWYDIVGDYLATSSQAIKVESGVLWVKVKNSTWLYHLTMLKSQIIRKIYYYTGNNTIKDIYFFLGEIETVNTDQEKEETNTVEESFTKDKLIDPGVISEWLNYLPEDQPQFKEKLERLLYKRYHIKG